MIDNEKGSTKETLVTSHYSNKYKKRKIVDFKVMHSTPECHATIFVLSSDGALYGLPIKPGEYKWEKLPDLPQD